MNGMVNATKLVEISTVCQSYTYIYIFTAVNVDLAEDSTPCRDLVLDRLPASEVQECLAKWSLITCSGHPFSCFLTSKLLIALPSALRIISIRE